MSSHRTRRQVLQYTGLGAQEAQRRAGVFQMRQVLAGELPAIVRARRRFDQVYDPGVFAPRATAGGLMNGIPFPNRLALFGP
jgi:hypothetical protein